jgi:hypothetical protein
MTVAIIFAKLASTLLQRKFVTYSIPRAGQCPGVKTSASLPRRSKMQVSRNTLWFILWVTAIGFLGFGLAFALWPSMMITYVDIQLPNATAFADFTATYGGFELGFGVFLMVCAYRDEWLEPGLWAACAALAGFAIVRAISMTFAPNPVNMVVRGALALEVLGTLANLWAARQARGK